MVYACYVLSIVNCTDYQPGKRSQAKSSTQFPLNALRFHIILKWKHCKKNNHKLGSFYTHNQALLMLSFPRDSNNLISNKDFTPVECHHQIFKMHFLPSPLLLTPLYYFLPLFSLSFVIIFSPFYLFLSSLFPNLSFYYSNFE